MQYLKSLHYILLANACIQYQIVGVWILISYNICLLYLGCMAVSCAFFCIAVEFPLFEDQFFIVIKYYIPLYVLIYCICVSHSGFIFSGFVSFIFFIQFLCFALFPCTYATLFPISVEYTIHNRWISIKFYFQSIIVMVIFCKSMLFLLN